MKIERTKNSIRSTGLGLVNKGINLLIPFIIRTVLIHKLGSEFLGLNSLFTSIIQVLNLTELGIGSALVYSMYKPIAEDDVDTLAALLNTYKRIYRIIGLIISVIGVCLIPILPWIVKIEELEGTGINLYALYLIYLFNTIISYLSFAYKKSLLTAYQRQDILSNINSIINIVLYSSQLLVLFIAPNYYTYIILMPVFTILDNIVVSIITNRRFPSIFKKKSSVCVNFGGILKNTKYIVGHKLGAVIIQSADSIVISIFLNLTLLTIYSNYFYVVSALVGIINVGYNAILAGVGNSIITKTKKQLYQLFSVLSFIIFFVVSFCSSVLLSLYQPFVEVWMGSEYLLPLETVILFVVYFYVWQIRVISLNFKDAAGMWKDDFGKPYVGIIVNMGLNILLVRFLGINGVLIATIVVMTAIYAPWETLVLHKNLFDISPKRYILKQLLYYLIVISVSAITYFITLQITVAGLVGLLIKAFVSSVITLILLLLICCRMPEFKSLLNRIKSNGR